jgi:hypothetical protein
VSVSLSVCRLFFVLFFPSLRVLFCSVPCLFDLCILLSLFSFF